MYFQNVLACVVRRGYAIFHRTAQLASVLHYASDAGSVELPDTRFAARKSPMDDGIAPTTLKNKARTSPAPIKAARLRRGRDRCPGGSRTTNCALAASRQFMRGSAAMTT